MADHAELIRSFANPVEAVVTVVPFVLNDKGELSVLMRPDGPGRAALPQRKLLPTDVAMSERDAAADALNTALQKDAPNPPWVLPPLVWQTKTFIGPASPSVETGRDPSLARFLDIGHVALLSPDTAVDLAIDNPYKLVELSRFASEPLLAEKVGARQLLMIAEALASLRGLDRLNWYDGASYSAAQWTPPIMARLVKDPESFAMAELRAGIEAVKPVMTRVGDIPKGRTTWSVRETEVNAAAVLSELLGGSGKVELHPPNFGRAVEGWLAKLGIVLSVSREQLPTGRGWTDKLSFPSTVLDNELFVPSRKLADAGSH